LPTSGAGKSKNLTDSSREAIITRYGLKGKNPPTKKGSKIGLTRERIRQIETQASVTSATHATPEG
jgi:DNA-directed RNA polymerase sigma subunit (sigma70/sigma32)